MFYQLIIQKFHFTLSFTWCNANRIIRFHCLGYRTRLPSIAVINKLTSEKGKHDRKFYYIQPWFREILRIKIFITSFPYLFLVINLTTLIGTLNLVATSLVP